MASATAFAKVFGKDIMWLILDFHPRSWAICRLLKIVGVNIPRLFDLFPDLCSRRLLTEHATKTMIDEHPECPWDDRVEGDRMPEYISQWLHREAPLPEGVCNINHLRYPDLPWNWTHLSELVASEEPELLLTNKDVPWDIASVMWNCPEEYILHGLLKPEWSLVRRRSNISPELFEMMMEEAPLEIILSDDDLWWDEEIIPRRILQSSPFPVRLLSRISSEFFWKVFTEKCVLSEERSEVIFDNPLLSWDSETLSTYVARNERLWHNILASPGLWDWEILSGCLAETQEGFGFIEGNKHLEWCWTTITFTIIYMHNGLDFITTSPHKWDLDLVASLVMSDPIMISVALERDLDVPWGSILDSIHHYPASLSSLLEDGRMERVLTRMYGRVDCDLSPLLATRISTLEFVTKNNDERWDYRRIWQVVGSTPQVLEYAIKTGIRMDMDEVTRGVVKNPDSVAFAVNNSQHPWIWEMLAPEALETSPE